jgi:flagellar biosynthesis chaperone FliJ
MTTSSQRQALRFSVLTRLHELQLEEARIERIARDAAVERQRRCVEQIESAIADSHARSRDLAMKTGGLSVEALRQLHIYMRWQAGALAEQRVVLDRDETLAEEARLLVVQRFERLAAIERFRERQTTAAALEQTRSAQHDLDDRAPVRAHLQKESAP